MAETPKSFLMGDHAAKPLSHVICGTFNGHPIGLCQEEYGANKGVGEIPLNGKGTPLIKGEEMVLTHMKV